MIEGGAVDWANHGNKLDRMIEEQTDFNNAVRAVVDYLDAGNNGNNWDNTLLIVTADHECGHLWGPDSFNDSNKDKRFDAGDVFNGFNPIIDNGPHKLPRAQYGSNNHTNALVPLFAKGAGAKLFMDHIVNTDSEMPKKYNLIGSFDGSYIDNTGIFHVMKRALVQ
jgi:alkaline phosphatase